MTSLLTSESLLALLTLTVMEIVLGIDNIIFIAILVAKVPKEAQRQTRNLGIALALLTRLGLLFSITWVMRLTRPLANVLGRDLSGRDFILLLGGLFLIGKATVEIHDKLEGGGDRPKANRSMPARGRVAGVVVQIMILDIVFSLDSVVTAVGMAQSLAVMVIAMVIAMGVMLVAAGGIGDFVHRHPTIKILALSFLVLIGVMLVAEAMGAHVSKGYIYFAIAFSLGVELLNIRYRSRAIARE